MDEPVTTAMRRRRRRRRPLEATKRRLGRCRCSCWMGLMLVVLLHLAGGADATGRLAFTRPRYNATIYENNIRSGKSYVTPEGERMGVQLAADAPAGVDIRYRIVARDKNRLFKAESRQVSPRVVCSAERWIPIVDFDWADY